jgi:curved DNA-binding protein CbpA
MIDPYRVLELPIHASTADVHTAYRELARRYHPDRSSDPRAAARMVELNEAYSWLKDESRRRKYDRRFVVSEPPVFQEVVIDAALERIRSSGVPFEAWDSAAWLVEPARSRTLVATVGVLGDVELDQFLQRLARWHRASSLGSGVILAYRVVLKPEAARGWRDGCPPGGAIDLARSEWCGAAGGPCPEVLEPFVAR